MMQDIIDQADASFAAGELDKARELYLVGLNRSETTGSSRQGFLCGLALAKIAKAGKKKKQALSYLSRCEELAEQIEPDEKLLDCYLKIAGSFYQLAQYQKAYEYLKKYSVLEDQINADRVSSTINAAKNGFELERHRYESMNIIDMASRLASIGVIVGGITHEINQPLSAINVNADSVLYWHNKNQGYLPEMIVEAATEISQSAKKIDDIISRMRHYWTSTETEPTDRVDLNSALKTALGLLNSQIAAHNIELFMDLSGSDLLIECNQIHIEQIIINLVVFTLQLSENSDSKAKRIRVHSYADEHHACVEVQDNIAQYQLRSELANHVYSAMSWGENFNLGLVIVKQAIDRFKGTLSHYANAGGGVTYKICFPLSNHKAAKQKT